MGIKIYSQIDSSDMAARVRALEDFCLRIQNSLTLIANAAGVTYTAAQVIGGEIVRSGGAALSDTLPSAAQMLAQTPYAAIGDTFEFAIQNQNSGLLTLVAGAGITLSGTTTVTAGNTRFYTGRYTAVGAAPAITLYGMGTGTS